MAYVSFRKRALILAIKEQWFEGDIFMIKREFYNNGEYIHIPICDEHPSNYHYIKIYDGEKLVHEFHIGVAFGEKKTNFYVALYLGNYKNEKIILACDDVDSDDFFDGFVPGKTPEEEKILYKNLYREPTRQQIHFSPRCGWMNDPNGLFIKDGVMNIYFQHNPFGSRHGGVNVSWGHATSNDGVHFKEYPDAIMPYNSKCSVASGSAFVDVNDICKKGKGTVIAAYTALQATQYCGRKPVTQNDGQILLFSKDNGMTFELFENNPIIAVPDKELWRDPKIFEYNGKIFAIVYEPMGDEKGTSFYISDNGREWEKISEGEKFHECPDFFEMEEEESGEKFWVLYGGEGQYSIGTFENYKFKAIEQNLFLDYGDSAYAGQTFSNNTEKKFRYHIAWLRDEYLRCFIADDYEFKGIGFNQGASLICKLTLRKTKNGYRIFRTPHENLKKLRISGEEITLSGKQFLDTPGEYEFTLGREKSVSLMMNGAGFTYNPETHSITSSNGKEYYLCKDKNPEIRMFTDTRSIEFFVNDEIVLSFFVTPETMEFEILGEESIFAKKYNLRSIWE